VSRDLYHRDHLFIDNTWVASRGGDRIEVHSPATEEHVGGVPAATSADLDRAVGAARRALSGEWAALGVFERAHAMERLAAALEVRAEDLARLSTAQVGAPYRAPDATSARYVGRLLHFFAGMIRSVPTAEVRAGTSGFETLVRRMPVGVVGMIVPYNGPLGLALYKLAPAMAAGCTAVIKPPPQAPLDLYVLAEAALDAGIPPGVINIVPGDAALGEALVGHPGTDKIAFTGSPGVGRRVAALCGERLTPVVLELGGKSAAILLDDVDLDPFLARLEYLSFLLAGQNCFMHSRILVPRSRYAEIAEAITATVASYPTGDPLDPATRIGPLISAAHRDRVDALVRSGVDEGATVATGGRRSAHDRGYFYEPTVVTDATSGMRVCQEEIFGPVVTLIAYDGDAEAIAIANDSTFGLAGSVWSQEIDRAVAVASSVETGSIGVNGFAFNVAAPFGGWKESGLGVELGREGLDAYVRYQSMHLPVDHRRFG
jgi:betaine-aldehyde dehydrogenase